MTGIAMQALKNSDTIIGYTVYVDLVKDTFPDKEFLTTPMKKEVDRCVLAFEEAMKGKSVSMICSGDAGVYGMAGLMYEVGTKYPEVELEIVPVLDEIVFLIPGDRGAKALTFVQQVRLCENAHVPFGGRGGSQLHQVVYVRPAAAQQLEPLRGMRLEHAGLVQDNHVVWPFLFEQRTQPREVIHAHRVEMAVLACGALALRCITIDDRHLPETEMPPVLKFAWPAHFRNALWPDDQHFVNLPIDDTVQRGGSGHHGLSQSKVDEQATERRVFDEVDAVVLIAVHVRPLVNHVALAIRDCLTQRR